MDYVELHCKSNFSFLEGANHPEELANQAATIGYRSLALTDTNGVYGAVRFAEAAKLSGIHPIFGSEVILENNKRLVLLAATRTGYSNLSLLLANSLQNYPKGEARVAFSQIRRYSEGLIALSGTMLYESVLSEDNATSESVTNQLREVFGSDNLFLELYHHQLPQHEKYCRGLISHADKCNVRLVATNDVYYRTPDDRRVQDVLTCIRNGVSLDNATGLLYPNNERYLKPGSLMISKFADIPAAIANTTEIAERCQFALKDLSTVLPDFPVPNGESSSSYLRKLVYDGAKRRCGELSEVVRKQLDHELTIIDHLNLSGYFLIVWDICRFCRERGILCQGRGSAANSAVCYSLEITAVDPIKLELLFERFLSEERREPPDIDIDIASDRREEAIQYVYAKYGRDHAAMVCNVICYRRRSAVREVAKTLGLSASDIDKLAKCLDHFTNDLKETEVRFAEQGIDLSDKRIRLLIELSRRLQGFPRHLGIHCGGMIVTKTPLAEIVPVENATMPNRTVIQWDKDDSADMGLVKIDLLGLGMLTLIDLALKLILQHRGETIDISKISYSDSKVYDLLCSADTLGVFQVESRAQMNTLPRMKPRCFYDLVVEVAIIRPGPIQGKMVHPYLRRRNGEEPVSYLHPSLEPALKRTLGIPLFQEQGIRVAMTAAGFSPAQADSLRRSIGHRQSKERIAALKESLIVGMGRNGIDATTAGQIYNQLAAFADFGFAESHAASFALLVYVSAWLKVYYPLEFYCSLLNAQPMGFYTPASIVYEALRKGVAVNNVCITKSNSDCTIEGNAIRLGLSYVLSLGSVAAERILIERTNSPFLTLKDFVLRTALSKHQVEQLAQVGAFDCFGVSRREALWQVLSLVRQSGYELELVSASIGSELLPAMRPIDIVQSDIFGLSLSTGPHPMALVRDLLKKERVMSSQDLRGAPDRSSVCACGMVVIRQRPLTAKGFVFITLEDETGFANIVVKPDLAKRFRRDVIYSNVLYVWGRIERKDGVVNVVGERFRSVAIDANSIRLKSRDFH